MCHVERAREWEHPRAIRGPNTGTRDVDELCLAFVSLAVALRQSFMLSSSTLRPNSPPAPWLARRAAGYIGRNEGDANFWLMALVRRRYHGIACRLPHALSRAQETGAEPWLRLEGHSQPPFPENQNDHLARIL